MQRLKPNEVIVTWVHEPLPYKGVNVHPQRLYLIDADAGTHSKYLSSAKRYTPAGALEAIKVLRALYPHMQVMFIQMLNFLPETENEVPRSPYAAARSKG